MEAIGSLLRRIFRPADAVAVPDRCEGCADPISRRIDAAVQVHEATSRAEREAYEKTLRPTLDELVLKIGARARA